MFKFQTQYRPYAAFKSVSGDSERIIYEAEFDSRGVMELVEKGKENLYDYIQSHADGVNIHVILKRYENGDLSALSAAKTVYGDFTSMPESYADLLNRTIKGRALFDSLPVEIKANFNHSFEQFAISSGNENFLELLGIKHEEPVQESTPEPIEPKAKEGDE